MGGNILWGEHEAGKDREGPHPLNTERDTISPLIISAGRRFVHCGSEKLSDDPTHVDKSSQNWSE